MKTTKEERDNLYRLARAGIAGWYHGSSPAQRRRQPLPRPVLAVDCNLLLFLLEDFDQARSDVLELRRLVPPTPSEAEAKLAMLAMLRNGMTRIDARCGILLRRPRMPDEGCDGCVEEIRDIAQKALGETKP